MTAAPSPTFTDEIAIEVLWSVCRTDEERREVLREHDRRKCVQRALVKYRESEKHQASFVLPELPSELERIKFALKIHGPLSVDELTHVLGSAPHPDRLSTLHQAGEIAATKEERPDAGGSIRKLNVWRLGLAGKVAAVLICVHLCSSVASAQLKGAALLVPTVPVSAVQTNKQALLTWQSDAGSFAIRTGTNRASVGNVQIIATNKVPFTNGIVYDVRAINLAGVESAPAFFPSNRVARLETQTSVDLVNWQSLTALETFTNRPARPRQFLRIVDVTTGWNPPN